MRIIYGFIGASLLLLTHVLTHALAEAAPKAMPGLTPFPAAVRQQLDRALRAQGDGYTCEFAKRMRIFEKLKNH